MGDIEYQEALKLGKKEYKACVSQGRFPYLPVLDDILSRENIQTEQNMGLMQIPLDFVVGTATKGRTYYRVGTPRVGKHRGAFCFWHRLQLIAPFVVFN